MKTLTLSELTNLVGLKAGEEKTISCNNIDWKKLGCESYHFLQSKINGQISLVEIPLSKISIKFEETLKGKSSVIIHSEDPLFNMGYQHFDAPDKYFITEIIRITLNNLK